LHHPHTFVCFLNVMVDIFVCAQTNVPDIDDRDDAYYTTPENRRPVSKDQALAMVNMARSYLKSMSLGTVGGRRAAAGRGGEGGAGGAGGGEGEGEGEGEEEAPFTDDDFHSLYDLKVGPRTCKRRLPCLLSTWAGHHTGCCSLTHDISHLQAVSSASSSRTYVSFFAHIRQC
jgi:hypothetical protein